MDISLSFSIEWFNERELEGRGEEEVESEGERGRGGLRKGEKKFGCSTKRFDYGMRQHSYAALFLEIKKRKRLKHYRHFYSLCFFLFSFFFFLCLSFMLYCTSIGVLYKQT